VEKDVVVAFDAIHALNVVHGDIRPENVLVAEENSEVWIVDFEFARIIDDKEDPEFSTETRAVKDMLGNMKIKSRGCPSTLPPPEVHEFGPCSLRVH
jgi:serine/threonine protein kinase